MGYIYLRTNLVNGKHYVGQTKDIKDRNRDWKNLNKRYGGVLIERARAKYGVVGFSFEVLKECPNEDMNYWEMYYIKMYNSKKPYGYNSTDGGDSTYEMTDEIKKKISDALRGRKQSPESIAKMAAAQRGKPKPKVSAALKGKKQSPETIEKRAAKLRGKPKPKLSAALKGKRRSEETRKKIAAAKRGKHYPKLSAAKRGMKQSSESIAKMAAALRGRKQSEETKKKISDANKNNPKKSKTVQALNPKTLAVVYEFPSTREAKRQGFDQGAISACCRNCYGTHKGNVYKGYIWRWKCV